MASPSETSHQKNLFEDVTQTCVRSRRTYSSHILPACNRVFICAIITSSHVRPGAITLFYSRFRNSLPWFVRPSIIVVQILGKGVFIWETIASSSRFRRLTTINPQLQLPFTLSSSNRIVVCRTKQIAALCNGVLACLVSGEKYSRVSGLNCAHSRIVCGWKFTTQSFQLPSESLFALFH